MALKSSRVLLVDSAVDEAMAEIVVIAPPLFQIYIYKRKMGAKVQASLSIHFEKN